MLPQTYQEITSFNCSTSIIQKKSILKVSKGEESFMCTIISLSPSSTIISKEKKGLRLHKEHVIISRELERDRSRWLKCLYTYRSRSHPRVIMKFNELLWDSTFRSCLLEFYSSGSCIKFILFTY